MSKFRFNKPFRQRNMGPSNNNQRRQMLDMRRQKYFRFDLDDLLVEFNIGENKNTTAATILNKMSSASLDDALDYVDRLTQGGTFTGEQSQKLKFLLQRYSKWR